ncbi:MAG: chemotaxis protein CheD [Haloarculaceae archaeon]
MKISDGRVENPEAESARDRVKVGITEGKVATNGAARTPSGRGSSIGVALHDEDTGISGLVHAMLPSLEEDDDGDPAKFADTGTKHLLDELEQSGANLDAVEARIAGDSAMLDVSDQDAGIGERPD